MPFKRLLALLTLSLGLLGVVACAAGIALAWSVGSRLNRANENAFDRVNKSLAAVKDRILGVQRRVQELKITTDDVVQGLRNWTQKATSERLVRRLAVAEKAEQLAKGLQQADQWLEMSQVAIQGVQQALELGSSIGAPVDDALAEPLLERLASLRSQLQKASEMVAGIRSRAAAIAKGASLEERIHQAVQLALRVVATLGESDSRLGEFADEILRGTDQGTTPEIQDSRLHLHRANGRCPAHRMDGGGSSLVVPTWLEKLPPKPIRGLAVVLSMHADFDF